MSRSARERLFALLFILPAAFLVFSTVVYPIFVIIQGSFHTDRILRLRYDSPMTLKNYEAFFSDIRSARVLAVTALYMAIATGCAFLLGFIFSLLLNQRFRGRGIARGLALLPWVVPASIAALLWLMLIDAEIGPVNALIARTGLLPPRTSWLVDQTTAFAGVCLASIWKTFPFFTIVLLAGLQAIPQELYEAAEVDGAGWWARLRHITIPGLRSVIAVGFMLVGLWTLRDFTIIFVMTEGGPAGATETLGLHAYVHAFQFFRMGYAAAVGVITLIVAIGLAAISLRLGGKQFVG